MGSSTGQRSSRSSSKEGRASRKQEYVDAAAGVFYRRGYDTATIGNIAEALDVTKAALYYYFESKEALLYEIIREMHLLNIANLERAQAMNGSAYARLWSYFEGHALVNLRYLEKATVVYRDLGHLSEERRRDIVQLRDSTQAFVRNLLTQCIEDELVCSKLDPEFASIEMFMAVNAVFSWYQPSGPLSPERAAKHVADFVLAGVACTGTGDLSCPRHHPPVS